MPDAGLRIHVRAKRFSGDGPEALMGASRGILGERRVWISSRGGAQSEKDGPERRRN